MESATCDANRNGWRTVRVGVPATRNRRALRLPRTARHRERAPRHANQTCRHEKSAVHRLLALCAPCEFGTPIPATGFTVTAAFLSPRAARQVQSRPSMSGTVHSASRICCGLAKERGAHGFHLPQSAISPLPPGLALDRHHLGPRACTRQDAMQRPQRLPLFFHVVVAVIVFGLHPA